LPDASHSIGRKNGNEKTLKREEKNVGSQVWQSRGQNRCERYAAKEEGHPSLRQGRQRRQGNKPQAGDRDRTVGSAPRRRQGAEAEIVFVVEGVVAIARHRPAWSREPPAGNTGGP